MEGFKTCLKCEVEKSTKFFGTNHSFSDHKNVYCKECAKRYSMPELLSLGSKVCTSCKVEMPRTSFEVRRHRDRFHIRSKCEPCLKAERRDMYWKSPEEFRKKTSLYLKKDRKENPDKYKAKYAKRDSYTYKGVSWKEYNKEYRRNNHHKLAPKQKERSMKWHSNARDTLSDTYIIGLIATQQGISRGEIRQSPNLPELIGMKRAIIKLKRLRQYGV